MCSNNYEIVWMVGITEKPLEILGKPLNTLVPSRSLDTPLSGCTLKFFSSRTRRWRFQRWGDFGVDYFGDFGLQISQIFIFIRFRRFWRWRIRRFWCWRFLWGALEQLVTLCTVPALLCSSARFPRSPERRSKHIPCQGEGGGGARILYRSTSLKIDRQLIFFTFCNPCLRY